MFGSVCTQPPNNDKDPPNVCFFISLNHFLFLKWSRSQMFVCVTSHRPRPFHDCWLTLAFYLRPALSELSSVRHCFNAGADVDKNGSYKWLRSFVVGCNNKQQSSFTLDIWAAEDAVDYICFWRECARGAGTGGAEGAAAPPVLFCGQL